MTESALLFLKTATGHSDDANRTVSDFWMPFCLFSGGKREVELTSLLNCAIIASYGKEANDHSLISGGKNMISLKGKHFLKLLEE